MVEVVCDAGSRYTKVAAGRAGGGAVVLVAPSQQAVDLAALARRAAAALSPGLFEPVRVFHLGDVGVVPGAASRSRLLPARPQPLALGAALAHGLGVAEALVVHCGALRTRVFEVGAGVVAARALENERCTAGAGRFVETMGTALGVDLAEVDAWAARAKTPVRVSSPCPVYAESEVVSQINAGLPREDVLAGVLAHAVEKVASLIERARPARRPVVPCGGLARFASFRAALGAAMPGTRFLDPPADPLLLPCLAALKQVTGAAVLPAFTQLPWESVGARG